MHHMLGQERKKKREKTCKNINNGISHFSREEEKEERIQGIVFPCVWKYAGERQSYRKAKWLTKMVSFYVSKKVSSVQQPILDGLVAMISACQY